ncbi:RNA polymerase sigma factor [Conexibacter sp. SYSU D00693]|uniref:RNA polymerase sigma factor n=1 Tax=Conexibacter sp. SYSU D00693 TaxID=2812560 RepID=UPI00196BA62B|nr:RNA polymerase sigma factor [Conexibacter sp. SYSU D00693]
MAISEAISVRRATGWDEPAFEDLHRRHGAAVQRLCLALLRDPEEAADAAQETWLRALQRLQAGGEVLAMRPWLLQVARNACADRAGALGARPVALEDPDLLEATALDPEAALVARADLRDLVADLRTLSEAQRTAFVLRELTGLEYGAVARRLDVRLEQAQWLVADARKALTERRAGRAMPCGEVRRQLGALRRRDRRVRAHLDACTPCLGFDRSRRARALHTRCVTPVLGLLGWARELGSRGVAAASTSPDVLAAGSSARPVAAAVAALALAGGGMAATTDRDAPRDSTRTAQVAEVAPARAAAAPTIRLRATGADGPRRRARATAAARRADARDGDTPRTRAVGRATPTPPADDRPTRLPLDGQTTAAVVPEVQPPTPPAAETPASTPAGDTLRTVSSTVDTVVRGTLGEAVVPVVAQVEARVGEVVGGVRQLLDALDRPQGTR